jgi:hypothetical protein
MNLNKVVLAILVPAVIISSCKKDNLEYNSNVKANLSVEFDNVAGSTDLQLNTATYTNAAGESFKVTKLKYYVSNFKLTNVDGTVYTVPQKDAYFLIDESDATTHSPVLSIPEGEYKSISFVVGVDSLRNTMDVSQRTGVLDVSGVATDMYWSWNSGYIFFKMDGTSPSITGMGGVFQYHVGGFGGYSTPTINNLKTITLDLTSRGTAKVKSGKDTNLHLMVDILKALSGATTMSFATTAMAHSPAAGVPIGNNYTNMFSHDHTEN